MTKFRVDRTVIRDGDIVGYQPVAWFVEHDDAAEYVREFSTDPLNTDFDYRIEQEN